MGQRQFLHLAVPVEHLARRLAHQSGMQIVPELNGRHLRRRKRSRADQDEHLRSQRCPSLQPMLQRSDYPAA
jgi:hypothetical protein